MKQELQGPFIFVTKSGHVFGATSVEATETDFIVRLKGLEHRLQTGDIEVAYRVEPIHPAARIDPGILSTVTALERLMVEFSRNHPPHVTTIFGSGSLALTLLPDRSTNDLDTQTDIEIELLDENLLGLLGPWDTRTSELQGPLGLKFRFVHPLDTVMQKLLRYSVTQFEEKDKGDIDGVITLLQPASETLIDLLTENPARYARLSGRFPSQADAIERNTRWFIGTYLQDLNFEELIEKTGTVRLHPRSLADFFRRFQPLILEISLSDKPR